MIGKEPKPTSPLTPGNAYFMAYKMGREQVEGNRVVFNMLQKAIFEGYKACLDSDERDHWRKLPTFSQLIRVAEKGCLGSEVPGASDAMERLRIQFERAAKNALSEAVPAIAAFASNEAVSADAVQAVLNDLAIRRNRQTKAILRTGDMMFLGSTRFGAKLKAQNFSANYYTKLPADDLTLAYMETASRIIEKHDTIDVEPLGKLAIVKLMILEAYDLGASKLPDGEARVARLHTLVDQLVAKLIEEETAAMTVGM